MAAAVAIHAHADDPGVIIKILAAELAAGGLELRLVAAEELILARQGDAVAGGPAGRIADAEDDADAPRQRLVIRPGSPRRTS
jgi:hypothetical protein